MERNGAIAGYAVVLDPAVEAVGVSAIVLLRFDDSRSHDRLVSQAMRRPYVVRGRCVSGDIDMVLDVACPSMRDLDRLRADLAVLPGVRAVTTYPVLRTHPGTTAAAPPPPIPESAPTGRIG
ncbi:MAG: Lrp/AsnC family transcriptional regulator [Alphaproteobacteria bacterium]